jgi:hypothetical protein
MVIRLSEEVKQEVMQDVFSVMPQVYKNFWNFQEVADFILLSYVVNGKVSDYAIYKQLKDFIVEVFKEGLKNYNKNGGLK